jgi:flavin-dependent dehydrogenase
MNPTRDVVIVGGGPAGTTTALALAHASPELARRVVVLEKALYPRDKPCAGALGARGDGLLRSIGVQVDVPSVRIDGIVFRSAEGRVAAVPGGIGRVVRRVEFDHALARAAAERGVHVRDGVRVDAVHVHPDGGAVVETSAGPLNARVVVGCDGVGSVVRKALGLGTGRWRAQVVEVDTEPIASDGDRGLLHFDGTDRRLHGYAWDFPTLVDGRALVCRGVYRLKHGEAPDAAPDVAAVLDDRLRSQGIDPRACKAKRYAERGFEPASRVAAGALMLAGEAAGIDPVTGEGIAQAIEYGVLAGRFLARLLSTDARPRSLEAWSQVLAASRLALDLRIRARFVRAYYGPARAELERFFVGSPDAMQIGCEHFAARPHDWLTVGEVVARGSAQWVARAIGQALSN